jgi:hypothetical protein
MFSIIHFKINRIFTYKEWMTQANETRYIKTAEDMPIQPDSWTWVFEKMAELLLHK